MPNQRPLSRESFLNNKVIFADGFVGGGKTLLGQIIASLDGVEMWVHRPLVEQLCGLHAHGEINEASAVNLLNCCFDNEAYSQALLRDSNFRPYDHSSIFKYPKKIEYLKRIFNSNDADLFNQFAEDNRALHFMSHGITAISEPIFQSLGDRLIFCRLTRCPSNIYMLNHLAHWSKRWGKESRNGMICNDVNGEKVPYFIVNRVEEYAKADEHERAIIMLEEWLVEGHKISDKKNTKIIEIPFENFVFKPHEFIEKIAVKLGKTINKKTIKEMKNQRVPRKSLDDAPKNKVFEIRGRKKPEKHFSPKDQILEELKELKNFLQPHSFKRVQNLSDEYVSRYLD